MKCVECNYTDSKTGKFCPKCGTPQSPSILRDGRQVVYSGSQYEIHKDLRTRPLRYHILEKATGKYYSNRTSLRDAQEDVRAATKAGGFKTPGWDEYWHLKNPPTRAYTTQPGPPKILTPKDVETTTDGLGRPIDPGIRYAVKKLNAKGFITVGSCEGHTTHGVPAPWVDIHLDTPERGKELLHAVSAFNKSQTKFKVLTHKRHTDSESTLRIQTLPNFGRRSPAVLTRAREVLNHFVDTLEYFESGH